MCPVVVSVAHAVFVFVAFREAVGRLLLVLLVSMLLLRLVLTAAIAVADNNAIRL